MKDYIWDSAGTLDQELWKIDRFEIYISVVRAYSLWPASARSWSIKYEWATNIKMTLHQREVLGMWMFKIVTEVGEVKGFVRRTK